MSAVKKTIEEFDDSMPLIYPRISKTVRNPNSIEAMTRETDRTVIGTFINIESPGQQFPVCCKYYKGMPYFSRVFQDGETATIPLSVARHINERCFHEPHSYLLDNKGQQIKSGKKVSRCKFIIEG